MDNSAIVFFTGLTIVLGMLVVLAELIVMCFIGLFSRKERNMFTDQIKAGAKLLDEKIPVWLERQDLERLYLNDTCNCVVGQANPEVDYVDTLMELFDVGDDQVALNKAHVYGFAIPDDVSYAEYPRLTEEWKAYIQERRTKQLSTIEQVP